jgi:uncharacterized membrane protein YfbV (UPF0208 family)
MNDLTMQFAELEMRVSELSTALERVTEERNNYKDLADSFFKELETCKANLKLAHSDISRLRTWIAQGVEL